MENMKKQMTCFVCLGLAVVSLGGIEPAATVDFSAGKGAVKRLNGVCNPPPLGTVRSDWYRETFGALDVAGIRFHDVTYANPGLALVDISRIFPLPHADADDPRNYRFGPTDDYIAYCREFTNEIEFRIGEQIEHYKSHYRVFPPKDYAKWARICEHIIRHYNECWDNGYRLNIRYWEIWNEPDLRDDPSIHNETWTGTRIQFFDFYETVAKHLKKCFPSLRIGGPSLARSVDYAEAFLSEMGKRNVPLDFFSWHIYAGYPEKLTIKAGKYRALLDAYGYEKTESILNEYNYVNDWQLGYVR